MNARTAYTSAIAATALIFTLLLAWVLITLAHSTPLDQAVLDLVGATATNESATR